MVAVGGPVIVTEWLESPASLASVIREGTQEERDHYGELLVRFLFAGPSRTGMLHADGSSEGEPVQDIVEPAIEKALEQSARTIVVRHHDDLGPLGGIGAVLRY